jgi:hypothetical protein
VQFIGVTPTFAACEALCLGHGATCTSWVWHNSDATPFARHCYSRSDGEWMPQPMLNDVCGRVNATEKPIPGGGFPASNVTYPNVPWPMPVHMTAGTTQVAIAPSLELTCSEGPRCDPMACEPGIFSRAVSRYSRLLVPPNAPPPLAGEAVIHEIHVCVTDAVEPLGPAMVENHTLSVPALTGEPILITAPSQHGALRALESLAHLISIPRPGRIVNAPVDITDGPRWPVRGLMVNPAVSQSTSQQGGQLASQSALQLVNHRSVSQSISPGCQSFV